MRTMLAVLVLLWASPAMAQDTIPVPWPVAVGGVSYSVQVDGVEVSTHSTEYGALRRAGLEAVDCAWTCDVRVGLVQEWRIDRIEVVRTPDAFAADSVTAYPAGVEPTDSLRVTDLYWREGLSHSCVTVDGTVGYAEVRTQEVDGVPYWVVIPADPDWWPTDCAPSMATLPELPSVDVAAYMVGIMGDRTPEPVAVAPTLTYDAGTLTATWQDTGEEWITYRLTYGGEGWTGAGWATQPTYQTPVQTDAGWFCVQAERAGATSSNRCNSWSTGGT